MIDQHLVIALPQLHKYRCITELCCFYGFLQTILRACKMAAVRNRLQLSNLLCEPLFC